MTWLLTFAVAAISGAAGLLVAGLVASLAVTWYRISSFEGGAGYFVIGIALAGGVAGAVIGLVVARAVAGGAHPGFLRALGASLGLIVLIAAVVAGAARLSADVPPEVDGHGLLLAVEFRWPDGDAGPASHQGAGYVELGSSSGGTMRKSEDGPLFLDLARQDNGHWIVPGVAPIFTTRGNRVLTLGIGEKRLAGFLMPPKGATVPGGPWSEWFPKAKPGTPALPDQLSYRYRVILTSEPVRVDSVGPFTIETVAGGFHRTSDSRRVAANSTFRIAYAGRPMRALQEAGAVAVIGGSRVALLVQATEEGEGHCLLVTDGGSAAQTEPIGSCWGAIAGEPLTADSATYHAARTRGVPGGWVDRETFATPGLYLVGNTVVDTRTLVVRRLVEADDTRRMGSVPPVSLSPDERSFAWFSVDGNDHPPVVGVNDVKAGTSYTMPVDPTRMRFRRREDVDPPWIDHHFVWVRGPDGIDRLEVRKRFTPLPYRGLFEPAFGSGVTMYSLSSGGKALRQALAEVLITQLGAVREPDQLDGYYLVLTIGGKTIKATTGGGRVSFSMLQGEGDPALMTKVAETLDRVLATGRYDALFVPDPE